MTAAWVPPPPAVPRNKPHSDSEGSTGDLTRLDLHPDDLLGNEQTRALCAHYLGQEAPVTRATLLKWRTRDFPDPLPCTRAGVELWDARQVRAWAQRWARERPGT